MKNMFKRFSLICLYAILTSACTTIGQEGQLSNIKSRRLVILGETITDKTAKKYADEYDAVALYTKSRGVGAEYVTKFLIKTIGPSSSMRSLMNNFISISSTDGDWTIIVPKIAEHYVLLTMKNMRDNSVTNAYGEFILTDTIPNIHFEREVSRVFSDSFIVKYK